MLCSSCNKVFKRIDRIEFDEINPDHNYHYVWVMRDKINDLVEIVNEIRQNKP